MSNGSAYPLAEQARGEKVQQAIQLPRDELSYARDRMPINVLANMFWLALNVGVGLWYTPYLIDNLGVAVYGLVPLASSVTNYLILLTQSLNSAVSRFLIVDLSRGDTRAANRIFNTAVTSTIAIIAFLLPVALILSWLAPHVFNVPAGYEPSMRWLVLCTMAAFMTSTFASSFTVSSYAYHRFDLRLLVNVVRLSMQVGIIVFLFTAFSPQLWQVGLVIFLSAFLSLVGESILWRKLTPELKVDLKQFDRPLLKQMLGFSGWVLANQVGALLFLNIDLLVANLVFGPEVAGRYGAVIIIPGLLRTLVSTVADVLKPMIISLYAQNDLPRLVRLVRLSIKSIGLAVALPIGLLCGLGGPLLTLWLGPEFSDLSLLVAVLVGHLCINVAVVPIFSLWTAMNYVRTPGIVTLMMGMLNAGLAIVFALWGGWGYVGIAVAGAIVLTAKNAFFTPIYTTRILKLAWWIFYPDMIASVVGCLVVGTGAYLTSCVWAVTGWFRLVSVAGVISGIYVGIVYFLGLNADDRHLLRSEILRRIKR